MRKTAKLAIISLCISLCLVGTFLASPEWEKREPQKANAIPVKNREAVRPVWIVAAYL
jgi:hypothetical protein